MSDYSYEIRKLRRYLEESEKAVFFGGAGVSTDSGIPDFRGSSGIYGGGGAEYFLSRECLINEPERFFEFYRENMLYPDAEPNLTHKTLATLESEGRISTVITQNIDGLHQNAGSENVIELHGTVNRCYCMKCGRKHPPESISQSMSIPRCRCGGIIRPDVTLYGEPLDNEAFGTAEEEIEAADLLIVGGTSLTVNPAASLITAFGGTRLVIINLSPTPYDSFAEIVINAPISEIFEELI